MPKRKYKVRDWTQVVKDDLDPTIRVHKIDANVFWELRQGSNFLGSLTRNRETDKWIVTHNAYVPERCIYDTPSVALAAYLKLVR